MTKIIENDDYIEIISDKFKLKNKVAAFDLDSTLIKTKSGKPYPVDEEYDWEFNYPNIKETLEKFINDNYCLIIITNQKNLKKRGIPEWCSKVKEIIKQINLPIKVYVSILDNIYRKPNIGLFDLFKTKINISESFYSGDAMGRKTDHADTDLKFAINCGLKFITPEKIFLNKNINVNYDLDYFDFNNFEIKQNKINFYNDKPLDMIIFVGYPGSGKSTFINKNLIKNKYYSISNDVLKTKSKCLKMCEQYMKENKKIVIDNTSPSKESREEYINLAKKYNYFVRCFKMTTDEKHARHNSMYRYLHLNKSMIPSLVYNIYKKKYEEPISDEGFYEIVDIHPELPSKITDSNYFFYLY